MAKINDMEVTTPPKNSISFGILTKHEQTQNGKHLIGKYRDYNIEVYSEKGRNKLLFVSDKFLNWVKHKFIYFINGKKHIDIKSKY